MVRGHAEAGGCHPLALGRQHLAYEVVGVRAIGAEAPSSIEVLVDGEPDRDDRLEIRRGFVDETDEVVPSAVEGPIPVQIE